MFYRFCLLLTIFAAGCVSNKTIVEQPFDNPFHSYITSVTEQYAPDKRTAIFEVNVHGKVLTGETNNMAAKADLLQRLSAASISFVDSIKILPAADVQDQRWALVTNSVANLRTQPRHAAELATQATLGTPLQVFKKERGWYLVQTPDQYIAWVDGGAIHPLDTISFANWKKSEKLLYTNFYGFAYSSPDAKGQTISDLVFGNVMELRGEANDFYQVLFPDGRAGYVAANEVTKYKGWTGTRNPTQQNLVETAKRLMGLPYLWGGTSFKGVDCSGFTKTVYFMNGLVLPRDASQQVNIGEAVDTKNGWDNLQPGDLLFFGSPARDGKQERVVHVGMWIGGNKEFIHSSGRVRISSFNRSAANYEEYELKRFLRAKRITPTASLADLRTTSLY